MELALPSHFEEAVAVTCFLKPPRLSKKQRAAHRQEHRLTDEVVIAGKDTVAQMPTSERSRAIATIRAAEFAQDLRSQGKCERCALQHAYCICEKLTRLSTGVSALGVGERIRFVVFMHVRERKRGSNTGKLIEHVLPNSKVLFHDVSADAEYFEKLIAETPQGAAFVLYPSADAVPVSQLSHLFTANHETLPERNGGNSPALAVLIDGTWNQARRMHKQFEALPHVALMPRARSEFTCRRQATEDRISTVEAAALLLEDLNEPPQVAAALRQALQELCGAWDRQCHLDTIMNRKVPAAASKPLPAHRLPKRGH